MSYAQIVVHIPIACTLSSGEATDRIEEWRDLLNLHVIEVVRTATSAQLRLRNDDETFVKAMHLARSEKTCCAFFEFRFLALSDAVWLEVETPDDGAPILDGLTSLKTA